MQSRRHQRGLSTLLIAMLLLGIVTVIALFAATYGVFEQRTAGNEYRQKIAFQAAETGLSRALEYVKVNTRAMLSSADGGWLYDGASRRWQACSEAKPATMLVDPCLAEPDPSRRGQMYRYVGPAVTGDGRLPLAAVLPAGASTLSLGDATSPLQATYDSYATLCRLDISTAVPRCSLAPTNEGTFYVTIVSRGSLAAENASASVKQSFGTFRLLGATPAAPLITAGVATGLGNAQLIPNPDAGGFGVPVSAWAKGDAKIDQASFASCQLGEWMANYGNPQPSADDVLNGVCESCTCNGLCPGYGLLSGNAQSCAEAKDKIEGEDILDRDSNFSEASPKVRDHKYFPDDLFAYVFGVPSSSAVAYLDANARKVTGCGGLGSADAGLIWNTGTSCDLKGKIGSLQDPVVLVSNSTVKINANTQFFGIIFVRSTAGTPAFDASGGPQVYGSVILEGSADLSGNPTIVYNKTVLRNVANSPAFLRYGPIPGSWSDTINR
jgi:hypothetical protein